MNVRILGILSTLLVLGACANPINRVTSDNYAETCSNAEANGNLKVAEQACYRALVNVDWGNLGDELKSQKLYNLGRIKRQLAKFSEAEKLFKESLEIEESISAETDPKIGRRLIELSVSLAAQDKWQEGTEFLIRSIPIAHKFNGHEHNYMMAVYEKYAEEMRNQNDIEMAKRFEEIK